MKLLSKEQIRDTLNCNINDCADCQLWQEGTTYIQCIKRLAKTALAYRKVLEKIEYRSFAGEHGFIGNCPYCGCCTTHEEWCLLGQILKNNELRRNFKVKRRDV